MWTEGLGYVTVVGDERVLVATEIVARSLLAQDERAREAMFPRTASRSVSVSNHQGYAEGRAAADEAVLHGRSHLPAHTPHT